MIFYTLIAFACTLNGFTSMINGGVFIEFGTNYMYVTRTSQLRMIIQKRNRWIYHYDIIVSYGRKQDFILVFFPGGECPHLFVLFDLIEMENLLA